MGSTAQLPPHGRGGGREAGPGFAPLARWSRPGGWDLVFPSILEKQDHGGEEGSGPGGPGGLAGLGSGLSAMKLEKQEPRARGQVGLSSPACPEGPPTLGQAPKPPTWPPGPPALTRCPGRPAHPGPTPVLPRASAEAPTFSPPRSPPCPLPLDATATDGAVGSRGWAPRRPPARPTRPVHPGTLLGRLPFWAGGPGRGWHGAKAESRGGKQTLLCLQLWLLLEGHRGQKPAG